MVGKKHRNLQIELQTSEIFCDTFQRKQTSQLLPGHGVKEAIPHRDGSQSSLDGCPECDRSRTSVTRDKIPPPKKTMKPKLWSFALYLSTQNVFLSFLVSVFLRSACFFNLSKRLSTPQHLTPRESREKTEERIGTPSLKVHLPESRGFFLLEFSSMDFFWWKKW